MKLKFLTPILAACGLALSSGALRAQQADDKETVKPATPTTNDADKPRDGDKPKDGPRDGDKPREGRRDGDPSKDGPPRGGKHPGQHDGDRRGQQDGDHRGPHEEMKPTAFIGVVTQPLSPEVRAQTGLPDGFGLLVMEVMPDSPAKTAGLQQHDVLVTLGDQRLVNQDQLSALVRAEKKDADITFTLKRAGAEQKVTVKVGEKMMPVAQRGRDQDGFNPFDHMRQFMNSDEARRYGQEFQRNMERYRDGMGDFQKRMKEFGEQMQQWARGPRNGPAPQAPQPPQLQIQPRDGAPNNPGRRDGDHRDGPGNAGQRPQPPQGRGNGQPLRDQAGTHGSRNNTFTRAVTRRDDSGEYSLRDDNGAKVFTVKPKDGEEQSFIVNTEEQRKAMPEQFRAKLRELEAVPQPPNDGTPPPPQPKQ